MAVFPTARRALGRPARLPWLIAAAALVAITLSIPGTLLLTDTSRSVDPTALVSETSSTGVEAPAAQAGSVVRETRSSALIALLQTAQREISAAPTASYDEIAAREAEYLATLLAAADSSQATSDALVLVAEVSQAAVQVVAEPATSSAVDSTTVAPATDAQAATAPAPAQPVVAPVQPVPAAPSGPVERWAAAGIVVETAGQDLDDASLANVDAALSALPSSVLSRLGNPAFGPIHILVNTEGRVLSGDQPYGGPANFFSTNEATNELVLYPQQSVFTIVHELGHAYNLRRMGAGKYAMVLLDAEMRSFLSATGWQITSTDDEIRSAVDHMHVDYSYSGSFHWPRMSNDDPLEDFANSFAMYFLDPGALQQSSPERYAWMAATFP